ncbi:MAG: DUF192 domain-containing protein [Halobacteriaceae archaeon]
MRIVHAADAERTLAEDPRFAEGLLAQGRGLMFRRTFPGDALVFPFDSVRSRGLHMLFVPFAIDAVWLVGGRVERVARLDAWTGRGRARADCVLELPAGAADGVEAGDAVRVER